jgi:hypothetical protein
MSVYLIAVRVSHSSSAPSPSTLLYNMFIRLRNLLTAFLVSLVVVDAGPIRDLLLSSELFAEFCQKLDPKARME